jgi:tetraacyldisaccharide 4'-kinase
MARGIDTHRLTRWLWNSRRADARLMRLGLLPVAAAWHAGMTARTAAYRRRWLVVHPLPLPSVAVGNLSVGGTGKTPLAIWIARYYATRGLVPGILLRGYGGDEALVHRQAVPDARVVANPDRVAGARQALVEGARVLVLDDAYQRLDVERDYNIAVVSAESATAAPWPLPAGPWRERWRALERADAVVVTRKQATAEEALGLARGLRQRVAGPVAVAHLGFDTLEGMDSGSRQAAAALRGKRVLVASGIGDPDAFAAQTRALGAEVDVATWRDHHAYDDDDIAWLARAASRVDHVVITQKDAVKLRGRWPRTAPEPFVALLDLEWEESGDRIAAALATIVTTQPETL